MKNLKHRSESGMFSLHASSHQFFFICGSNSTKGKSSKGGNKPSVPSLLPYLCQYLCICCIQSRVLLFSPLDTPHSRIAPGPLVECCIVRGLWRKGILGHGKSASVQTHTHANTLTDTCKHVPMDKYSCWEPSRPFGGLPNQRLCW